MLASWANVPETEDEMLKKLRFTKKFTKLSQRRSNQRIDVLRQHLSYAAEQQIINETISRNKVKKTKSLVTFAAASLNEPVEKKEKIKYYPGGNPIRDRKQVNEKLPLTLEELDHIREYSHYLCRKRLDKIDIENNEKVEKLVLPYIANNFK